MIKVEGLIVFYVKMKLHTFLTVLSLLITLNLANKNNVCKNWWAYNFKAFSKDCYYDVNANSDAVSSSTNESLNKKIILACNN